MPRRERRKCSVCEKTGHNKRTCPVFAKQEKQKQLAPVEPVLVEEDLEIEEAAIASTKTETETPFGTGTPSVFVHVGREQELSPHVVDLRDTERAETLANIDVFRQQYARVHSPERVDFAAMVRDTKVTLVAPRKKTKAFQVATETTPLPIADVVAPIESVPSVPEPRVAPSPLRVKPKRRRTFQLPNVSVRLPQMRMPQVRMPQFAVRPMAVGISMLALLIAIPFPALGYIAEVKQDSADIVAVSSQGFAALQASTLATVTADMDNATAQLQTALGSFSEATALLETKHTWLQSLASVLPVVGNQLQGRQQLLAAGHHMALGNTYLLKGIQSAQAQASSTLTYRLDIVASHLKGAVTQYDAALTAIAGISDTAIPKEYRTEASEFTLLFGTFVDDMYDVLDLIEVLQLILGNDGYKKYLVMFQNQEELRPTGGFMGSFATLEVQKGAVSWDIPTGGTYDVQGQLSLNYAPPLPLQLMNSKWELQDANWWSHLPVSASVIEEMYEDSRGATVDGVFFVNATVLVDVLEAIGPVIDEATGLVLDSESVMTYISDRKATDIEAGEAPKQVLGDMLPALFTAVEAGGQDVMLRLLVSLTNALNERSVQLYAHNPRVQETLREYGWTGEVRETDGLQDYLHIVRTNLQGQKTDANIDEHITLDTKIRDDGRIINTLTITRANTGPQRGPLYDATNISYLRIYVPEGSRLLTATGFEFPPESAFKVPSRFSDTHPFESSLASRAIIDRETGTQQYTEFNKSVFANWMIVPRGDVRTMHLTYELPFTVEELSKSISGAAVPYTMMHQKQSGAEAEVLHTITFPEDWDVYWQSNETIQTGGNFALYKDAYERDMYYGMILSK